jgi:hypothetical protein
VSTGHRPVVSHRGPSSAAADRTVGVGSTMAETGRLDGARWTCRWPGQGASRRVREVRPDQIGGGIRVGVGDVGGDSRHRGSEVAGAVAG